MFLRRLNKNIKEQNWFAVFLDFFIVVAGIFIGMQVTQFYQQLESKAQYHKNLSIMIAEADEKSAYLQTRIENLEQNILPKSEQILEMLSACQGNDEAFTELSSAVAYYDNVSFALVDIGRITQNPALNQFLSIEFSQYLTRYQTEVLRAQEWGKENAKVMVTANALLSDLTGMSAQGKGFNFSLLKPFNEACQDRQLIKQIKLPVLLQKASLRDYKKVKRLNAEFIEKLRKQQLAKL